MLLRRRIATVTVAVLAGLLFVHVMFGANGMIVYKQKRTEYESLQKRIVQEQKENELYSAADSGIEDGRKSDRERSARAVALCASRGVRVRPTGSGESAATGQSLGEEVNAAVCRVF